MLKGFLVIQCNTKQAKFIMQENDNKHILRGGCHHYEWFSGGSSIKLKIQNSRAKITLKIHKMEY